MLHHKVYQNKLIQIQAPTKNRGFFYAIHLNRHLTKKQMQQLKHKQFTTVLTGTQVWHEQSSLPIRYCYVPATTGFAAIGSMSNNDKKRPWIER